MSEEINNVSGNAENSGNTVASQVVTAKISQYSGKVDAIVEKILGVIGNKPWDAWLKTANGLIAKFLPAAIALAGLLAIVTALFTMVKQDFPVSWVLKLFLVVIPVAFSMHLAPKVLSLTRSFIEKNEASELRPELMYIVKVLFGIGGLLSGVGLLLCFEKDLVVPAIIAIVVSVLLIICLCRPEVIGVKAGYPVNCVEEVIAIVMFPIRVVIALLTLIVGLAAVGGIVYGVVLWFDNGIMSAIAFGVTAVVPFLLPFAVYIVYLFVVFVLDFYRAIVSIPRKLDEMKK